MAFPRIIISRTFQQASAALAKPPLVCLTEGAGIAATRHWGVMKGLALPTQHRPPSQGAQHKTQSNLGMGLCCTLESGKLNTMAK